MKAGLQTRISIAMWLIAAVSSLATAFLFGSLLISSHLESVRQQLQSTAVSLISLGISDVSELEDFNEMNRFVEDGLLMERENKLVRIYDQRKILVFTTVGMTYDPFPIQLDQDVKKPMFVTLSRGGQTYESLLMSYEVGKGKKRRLFYLQVAQPLPRYREIFENIRWQSLGLLFGLFAISFLVSRWLAKLMIRPVTEVAAHLEAMDPKRIEAWKPLEAPVGGGRYLDAIVAGINQLTQRTRASVLQLRKMSRYVAHELRTPLTILRGEAETALLKPNADAEEYRKILNSSLEEVQRMTDTIGTVLQVGESSSALTAYHPVDFEVAHWLRSHIPGWERLLDRKISLEIPATGIFHTRNDPKLLFRLMDNLVRNVQRHAPAGATCTMGLKLGNPGLLLFIEDQGLPVPDWMVEAMNRTESVLETEWVGLNLCHTLAQICGVPLKFSAREGGGLRVEILLET